MTKNGVVKILVALALLACCSFADKPRLGFAGGGSLTSMVGDSPDFIPSSGGYAGTVTFDGTLDVKQDLALRLGIGVEYRDFRSTIRSVEKDEYGDPIEDDEILSLLYLQVPVYARFKATSNTLGEVGPVFAFNLLSKYHDVYADEWHDIKTANVFQLGFSLGLGLIFTESLELDMRFDYMFTNMFDKDKVGPMSQMVKFQLGFSYWILK